MFKTKGLEQHDDIDHWPSFLIQLFTTNNQHPMEVVEVSTTIHSPLPRGGAVSRPKTIDYRLMVLNFEQDSGYVLMEVETSWWLTYRG